MSQKPKRRKELEEEIKLHLITARIPLKEASKCATSILKGCNIDSVDSETLKSEALDMALKNKNSSKIEDGSKEKVKLERPSQNNLQDEDDLRTLTVQAKEKDVKQELNEISEKFFEYYSEAFLNDWKGNISVFSDFKKILAISH